MKEKMSSLLLLIALVPSVLLVACGGRESAPPEPEAFVPDVFDDLEEAGAVMAFQETDAEEIQNLGLYTSESVRAYVAEQNPGFTIPPASGISSTPADVDLTMTDVRLDVQLKVGTAGLGEAIVDTGSSGVVVSCGSWLSDNCADIGNDVPRAFVEQQIYVTDVKVGRAYGNNNWMKGYVALASVSLGDVNAAMPFLLITTWADPYDATLHLVGVNSDLEQGFVSPMQYFDYSGGTMDVGFSLTTTTMTIGLDSLNDWTTVQQVKTPTQVGTQAPTWSPNLAVDIEINTLGASGTRMLFDTGTPPGDGTVYVPQSMVTDCKGSNCTLTTTFGETAVNKVDTTFGVEEGPASERSILGLGFLSSNTVGSGFLMDFTTGNSGFKVSR